MVKFFSSAYQRLREIGFSPFYGKIVGDHLVEKKKGEKTLQLHNSTSAPAKEKNQKPRNVLILKVTQKYGTFALFYYQPKAVSCSTRILWFLVHSVNITNGNYGAIDSFTDWKKIKPEEIPFLK